MARQLTTALEAATLAPVVRPALLVGLDFASGPLRLWSGIGKLTWAGNDYLGAGQLLAVAPATETQGLSAEGATLALSGIPAELLSIALAEAYQGRSAKVWLAAFDLSGALVADPYLIFDGRMDVMTIDEAGETSTISVTAESRLIDLERPRERRYTDEDQRIEYPDDAGCEFVAGLADAEITWGRKGAVSGAGGGRGGNGDFNQVLQ